MKTIGAWSMMILLAETPVCIAGEPGQPDELALDLGPATAAQPAQPVQVKRGRKPRCLKKEPRISKIIEVAWERAGLQVERDRSRAARVRAAGWLPKLTGGVSKDIGGRWDYRYESGSSPVDQLQQSDGWRWDAGLSIDLSRIVYDSDELSVAREASRRALDRMEIAEMVVRLYFVRLRILVHGLPRPGTEAALKVLEATAALDAWTGGRFARNWCEVKP